MNSHTQDPARGPVDIAANTGHSTSLEPQGTFPSGQITSSPWEGWWHSEPKGVCKTDAETRALP